MYNSTIKGIYNRFGYTPLILTEASAGGVFDSAQVRNVSHRPPTPTTSNEINKIFKLFLRSVHNFDCRVLLSLHGGRSLALRPRKLLHDGLRSVHGVRSRDLLHRRGLTASASLGPVGFQTATSTPSMGAPNLAPRGQKALLTSWGWRLARLVRPGSIPLQGGRAMLRIRSARGVTTA